MNIINSITKGLSLKKEDLLILALIAKTGKIKGSTLSSALWRNDENIRIKRCKKFRKLKDLNLIMIEKEGVELVISLTDKGASYLPLTGQKVVCSKTKNPSTLIHDELVASIAAKAIRSKNKIIGSILLEEEIQKLKLLKSFIPDILVKNSSGRFSAIEVELTQKENRRFLEKIEFYKNSIDFEHIFYICSNENLKSKFSDKSEFQKFSAFTLEELGTEQEKLISKITGIWDMSFYKGWS